MSQTMSQNNVTYEFHNERAYKLVSRKIEVHYLLIAKFISGEFLMK